MKPLAQTLLLSISILCFTGCSMPPTQKWNIVLTSPSGEQKTYTVMSYEKPTPVPALGGQIGIRDYGHILQHDWERQIIAPIGWMVTVEEAQQPKSKS